MDAVCNLDVIPGKVPPVIQVSQSDPPTALVFRLYPSSGTLSLPSSGITAAIRGMRNNGAQLVETGMFSIDQNIPQVRFDSVTPMIAVPGKSVYEMLLTDGTNDLYTENFIIQVLEV